MGSNLRDVQAIQMAWELVTDVYKLPKDMVYVSVYE